MRNKIAARQSNEYRTDERSSQPEISHEVSDMKRKSRTALILIFALCLLGGLILRAAGWEEPWQALAENQRPAGTAPVETAAPTPEVTPTPEPTPEPTPTPLANGARGDDVTAIQKQLTIFGFFTGAQDGIFGPRTEQAVKDYQQYRYDQTAPTPAPTPEETEAPADETAAPDETGAPAETPEMTEAEATEAPTPEPTYAPDGVVSDEWKDDLLAGDFEVYQQELTRGSRGAEVVRLQTRLAGLRYYDTAIDGQFGGGTAGAVSYFQRRNDLPETGVADEATQRRLFSEEAVKSDRPSNPYKLVIDISDQRVYAYKWVNGSYSSLVRTMICSTGLKNTPTPLGTFKNGGPAGRWYYFKKYDCWAQYAWRIDGPILFHSVLYSEKDTSTLRQSSVNNLGSRASHGCVRLKVADAKWIYNNCAAGTTVVVQN